MYNEQIEDLKRIMQKRNIKSGAKTSFKAKNNSKITKIWMTVNRFCNFRCPWCYAESTEYDNKKQMRFNLAKSIVDFAEELKVKEINIIGGEPLYYPNLENLIKYINKKNIRSSIVTNGYRFSNTDFFKKIENAGLSSMGFSIKGFDQETYIQNAQVDAYENIIKAINNIAHSKKIKGIYTVVVTESILEKLEEIAKIVSKDRNKKLLLILCGPVFDKNGLVENKYIIDTKKVINSIVDKYSQINKILDGRLLIEQSLPLCSWPREFINELKKNNQIKSGCHVYRHSGLIFNTKGELIICNSLNDFPIAKFGQEFSTASEFEKFWNSDKIFNIYKSIYKYPIIECEKCNEFEECLGGCPLKWFVYDTKIINEFKKEGEKQ